MVSLVSCKSVRTCRDSSRKRTFSSRVPTKGSIFPAMCIVRLIHEGLCDVLSLAGFPMAGKVPGTANRWTASRSPICWSFLLRDLTATHCCHAATSRRNSLQPTVLPCMVQDTRSCSRFLPTCNASETFSATQAVAERLNLLRSCDSSGRAGAAASLAEDFSSGDPAPLRRPFRVAHRGRRARLWDRVRLRYRGEHRDFPRPKFRRDCKTRD